MKEEGEMRQGKNMKKLFVVDWKLSSSAIDKVLEASAFPEEETGVGEFTEYALL